MTSRPSISNSDTGPGPAKIDLRKHLRPGDTVIWGQGCAEPLTLTAALAERASETPNLGCFLGIGADNGTSLERLSGLRFIAYGGGGTTRRLDSTGQLDVLTSRYSDLPRLFQQGRPKIDVAFVQVTPGLKPDTFQFTLAAEYLVAAVESARVVIAEVNHGAPHMPNAPTLHASQLAALVHSEYSPAIVPASPPTEVDAAIASHVSMLVENGATLQVGIGTLPEAIVRGLVDHTDLGVHSGAIGDALADLIERGSVTNRHKVEDRGVSVGGVLLGTERLFRFAHQNGALAIRDTTYTHDPGRLASLPRLTTINAAVEVDLTGQVNTEVAAGRYIGAAGGSLDFARAAALSDGGVPITVLRSTASGRSTIVAEISGPVAIPRSEVGWVVTEYGAVDLRGLSLGQRRRRLATIAHPEHRDALLEARPGPGEAVDRQAIPHTSN